MNLWTKGTESDSAISSRAHELRRIAAIGLTHSGAVAALANALGYQIFAIYEGYNASSLNDILQAVIDEVWKAAEESARDARDRLSLASDNYNASLSELQFTCLTQKLIFDATANGTLPSDALAALAKALGTLSTFTARREGCSEEEVLTASQEAVATFAAAAKIYMCANADVDPKLRTADVEDSNEEPDRKI